MEINGFAARALEMDVLFKWNGNFRSSRLELRKKWPTSEGHHLVRKIYGRSTRSISISIKRHGIPFVRHFATFLGNVVTVLWYLMIGILLFG